LVAPRCERRPGTATIRTSIALAGGGDEDPPRPTTRCQGIAVTPPDWTVCTLASVLSVSALCDRIVVADRKRLTSLNTIERTMHELPEFKGIARLREAIARLRGRLAHSAGEHLARDVLEAADLRPHPRPYTVEDDSGLVAEVDVAFVPERVGAFVDGPHHDDPDQRRHDQAQRHRLRMNGWIIVETDHHRLERAPQVFVRQVREAVESRRHGFGASGR
jgi:hypothetical protein